MRSTVALSGQALAVDGVTGSQIGTWLSQGGSGFAYKYAPIWFFGQSEKNIPCIPTWAYGGTPDTPDVYDNGHRTQPSTLCAYPDVSCYCRHPGVGIGNPSAPFPVYFTIAACGNSELRIIYNLFYQKDGTSEAGSGHAYDWERVVVVINANSNTADAVWYPTAIKLSQHRGYQTIPWASIQNTLTDDEVAQGKAKDPNGVRNNNHAKVYVAWSKHANYDTRKTGYNDIGSQLNDNAFRSQDWWYFPEQKYYILADNSTVAGKKIESVKWGEADSTPVKVNSGICSQ